MLAARTPIAVYCRAREAHAPRRPAFSDRNGGRHRGHGAGYHMGAAHPVTIGGDAAARPDEATMKKVASDLAAWARSLAERRRRNIALAAEAVTDSRAFTDSEALAAKPPLIDLVASDLADLIRKLDGAQISRFDGRTVTIASADARVVSLQMTRRQQLLSAIAHPQIAYLLMTLGILASRSSCGTRARSPRRRWRSVPAARVLCLSGAAREHGRTFTDRVRTGAAGARDQASELRCARPGRCSSASSSAR